VQPTEQAVARRCITLGLVDGTALTTTSIIRPNGELSLHLDPKVRPRRLAIKDLQMIVDAQKIEFSVLSQNLKLAPLLRCEPNPRAIADALVLKGIPVFQRSPARLDQSRQLHPAFDSKVMPEVIWKANLRTYLKDRYSSLDDLHKDRYLAEALSVRNTAHDIAKAVIKNELMSWRAPLGFTLFGIRGGSFYVDKSVMGDPRRVSLNIRRSLRGIIDTLDDVSQIESLSSALGCEKSASGISRALVEQKILSATLPSGHPFTFGRVRSRYFEPEVVGPEMVQTNIKAFLKENAPTLDDLPMIDALCNTLQVERRRHALAKFLVEANYIDWRIPTGHDVQRAGGSLYFNNAVIGREKVEANLRTYLIENFGGNLDNLPGKSKSLSSALGVANNKGEIAREIVMRGILPSEPPTGHSPNLIRQSIYNNPKITGRLRDKKSPQ
jgi:hypothetical protein